MERTKLSDQMKEAISKPSVKEEREYDGDFGVTLSTGSTLLDLAISGGRKRGGGIPGGILVEIFGPSGSGKTVLLSEIAGNIQRKGGQIKFYDPEARLNKQFSRLFGLELDEKDYSRPDTVPEVFSAVRDWEPESKNGVIHGIFADSLAALSTDQELEKKEGDKMGMRRPKEFSEELRKTCRIIANKNFLMVCSNQVRDNVDAGPYAQKEKATGGRAFEFYASLRLRFFRPEKIIRKETVAGKEVKRVVGVETLIEVNKSSLWKPYHSAPVTILFDYGIDDISQNLQFIKDFTKYTTYTLGGETLSKSKEEAIKVVEEDRLEKKLREEVINLWEEIEDKFKSDRKPKR